MTHHLSPRSRQLPRWVVPAALAAALVVIAGVGVAFLGSSEPETPEAAPTAPARVTHDPPVPTTTAPTPSILATASIGPVETQAAQLPVVAFGEGPADGGFYPVSTTGRPDGITIKPGTYRSAGVSGTAETARCFWERRSGSDSEHDRTTDPVTIRNLRAGEFFRSQGCQQWVRVS